MHKLHIYLITVMGKYSTIQPSFLALIKLALYIIDKYVVV